MTTTKYTQMARAARPHLLELMSTRAKWADDELRAALRLEGPVLQTVLLELTAEGLIRRRFVPTTPRAVYSVNDPAARVNEHRTLSPVQHRTYTYLLGRRETLVTVAAALRLPKEQVAETLAVLDDWNLIRCAFVGHLAVFSRTDA